MNSDIVEGVNLQLTRVRKILLWFIDEVRWIIRVIISSCDRFYWDNGFSKAASLAYTTLLSLVPVTALGFSILASFVAKNESIPELRDFIIRLFQQFAPSIQAVETVINYLTDFSKKIESLNELAIVFLLITSILLLNSVEYALNEIWQVYEVRSIPHRIARFCAIMVIAPVLAISGYYTTRRFTFQPFLENIDWANTLNQYYEYLLPFLVDFSAFLLLYYLIPKAPVRFASATFGAFLSGVLFGLAKEAFALYVVHFSSHAAIYGTLAAIPIFLFWLYISWTIVLLGAESCYQAQYLPRSGKLWKRSVLSLGDGKILLAMQALVIIAKSFRSGIKMPSDLEIAERLGCSSVVLKPALDSLAVARIIVRGDNNEMPLALLKSPDTILLSEVRDALYKSDTSLHYAKEMMRVFENFKKPKDTAKLTVADIIED